MREDQETGMIKIAPSVLSADFSKLGAEVGDIESCGADYIHFDIMDGVFVPNISFGIPVLRSLRSITDMTLDVHLMIDRPIRYIKSFCDAGADIVTVHAEADTQKNIEAAIEMIKSCGRKAGLSVKPATPAEAVLPFIDKLDLILVMTVEPGFGGQSFMYDMLPKITEIRKMTESRGLSCEIEVDGGINTVTARSAAEVGADVLVSGSFIFNSKDRRKTITALREA